MDGLKCDWLEDVAIPDSTFGTCEWVLRSDEFEQWRSSSAKCLCIVGSPGSGKTVLANFLYRHLAQDLAHNEEPKVPERRERAPEMNQNRANSRIISYFFDARHRDRGRATTALRSLLHQVLSSDQRLFQYVYGKKIFSEPSNGDYAQYAEVLITILKDESMRDTIVLLDALDECEHTSTWKITDLLAILTAQPTTKLLITSRSNPWDKAIVLSLDNSGKHVESDIRTYVQAMVNVFARRKMLPTDLKNAIVYEFVKRAGGSFLWVQLGLKTICEAVNARELRQLLASMPTKFMDLYSDFLDHFTGSKLSNIRRALYFVMVAETPLLVENLSTLLAISLWLDDEQSDPSNNIISQRSQLDSSWVPTTNSFIEFRMMGFEEEFMKDVQPLLTSNEGFVSLVHPSLRDFLSKTEEIARFRKTFSAHLFKDDSSADSLNLVHSVTAALCLYYTLAAQVEQKDPLNFLKYASVLWVKHTRNAHANSDSHLKSLLKFMLLEREDIGYSWLHTLNTMDNQPFELLPTQFDLPFVLAAFDLGLDWGQHFHISMQKFDIIDQQLRTPLHFAAANGALSSVKWILHLHASAGGNLTDLIALKDHSDKSAIRLATANGHLDVVKSLLTSVEYMATIELGLLQTVAETGNEEILQLLYDNVDHQDMDQLLQILPFAAKLGSVPIIENILDVGIWDPNRILDKEGSSMLHLAVRSNSPAAVHLLLARGTSPNHKNLDGLRPLHVASQEEAQEIVTMLIQMGADVDAQDRAGDTALHYGSAIGSTKIVRILIDAGANPMLRNKTGCLPIHLSSERGHVGILSLLCAYIDPSVIDNNGRTPLHIAAGTGHEGVVTLLLERGADVNAHDSRGSTALHSAIHSGNLKIVLMLCMAGADVRAVDECGTSPLHVATLQGSDVLIRHLIQMGADVNSPDSKGRAPLHLACESKQQGTTVMCLLLEAGANPHTVDGDNSTLLHKACDSDSTDETILKILLRSGADPNLVNTSGNTPLHLAARKNRAPFVRELVDHGANVHVKNRSGLTPGQCLDTAKPLLKSMVKALNKAT